MTRCILLNTWAVHLADGQLDPRFCLSGWLLALPLLVWALRNTREDQHAKVALFSAVFFLGSLIHIPTPFGVRAHLLLTGLLGITLGPASIPAIAAGLTLQSIFFGHGGISCLGLNLLVVGIPSLIGGIAFNFNSVSKKILFPFGEIQINQRFAGFLIGFSGVIFAVCLQIGILFLAGTTRWTPQIIATPIIYLPLAIAEGLICSGVTHFIFLVQPEFFPSTK